LLERAATAATAATEAATASLNQASTPHQRLVLIPNLASTLGSRNIWMTPATRTNEFGHDLGFYLEFFPTKSQAMTSLPIVTSQVIFSGSPSKLRYGALSFAVTLNRHIVHLGSGPMPVLQTKRVRQDTASCCVQNKGKALTILSVHESGRSRVTRKTTTSSRRYG